MAEHQLSHNARPIVQVYTFYLNFVTAVVTRAVLEYLPTYSFTIHNMKIEASQNSLTSYLLNGLAFAIMPFIWSGPWQGPQTFIGTFINW